MVYQRYKWTVRTLNLFVSYDISISSDVPLQNVSNHFMHGQDTAQKFKAKSKLYYLRLARIDLHFTGNVKRRDTLAMPRIALRTPEPQSDVITISLQHRLVALAFHLSNHEI